jgi:hypothetical protein
MLPKDVKSAPSSLEQQIMFKLPENMGAMASLHCPCGFEGSLLRTYQWFHNIRSTGYHAGTTGAQGCVCYGLPSIFWPYIHTYIGSSAGSFGQFRYRRSGNRAGANPRLSFTHCVQTLGSTHRTITFMQYGGAINIEGAWLSRHYRIEV